jgi:antitoxin component YwqK of YwqJK toxin-antitoxin module
MMKMLLLTLGVLASITVSAQKKQNLYYFKNDLRVVDQDSADFIRIIQEPDSGSKLYTLFEIYPDGTKKTQGTVGAFSPKLYYQGTLLSFNKNGTRKSVEEYVDNELVGKGFYYFENGTLERSVEYVSLPHTKVKMKLMSLADSTGHSLVKDGNGHVHVRLSASSLWQEEGDYVNGEKHGVWATRNPTGDSSYKEVCDHGEFINGESLLQGISYTYKVLEEAPICEKGMNAFFINVETYISNLRGANPNNVYGKIFLSFSIEPDGSLSNQRIDRSLDPHLDKLALRAIDTGLKWKPGRQHGIPISTKFNIPIGFSKPEKEGTPNYTFPDAMSRH